MHRICSMAMACLLPIVAGTALAAPVNVNTADAQAIAVALNGVGAQKAEAIVAYREAHGPFTSPDDLMQVKGVGQAIVDKNRSDILTGEPAAK